MRKIFLLIQSFFCFYILSAQDSTQTIIIKFKKDVSYKIDQSRNSISTNNYKLSQVINKSNIKKIRSLIINDKSFQSFKRVDLVKDIHFLQINANDDASMIINELMETGMFEYVESDGMGFGSGTTVTPNDTYYNRQWGLNNDGSFNTNAIAGADVDMDLAWNITTGSNTTVVCILDSGLNFGHPEFAGRIWTNSGEIPNNAIDDDNNGLIDDIYGWDWVNNDNDATDDHGHGTNVTGIMAANGNNNDGYAGANWKCKIMIGKILNAQNQGSYSNWTKGILYAVQKGAKVINMSVGGTGFNQAMQDACDFAKANNVAIFACMMNNNNDVPNYPAAFTSTIAVGATTYNDYRASFSNFGAHLDLVSPGASIYGLAHNSNTNYDRAWSGTSQATPLVAGVASLMFGLKPDFTVDEIKNILRSTAKDLIGNPAEDIPGWDQYMGAGRMNANSALSEVIKIITPKISVVGETSFCDGGSVTLVSSNENGNQWYKNGVLIQGATNKSFIATQAATYSVKLNVAGTILTSADVTVTIKPVPPKPVISITNNTLQSSSANGNQWYVNNTFINGANSQNFTPTNSGQYSVNVTSNGCTSIMSENFSFVATSINSPELEKKIIIAPNPAQENLVITYNNNNTLLEVKLLDITCKLITEGTFKNNYRYNISGLSNGSYFVQIINRKTGEKMQKMIIKN